MRKKRKRERVSKNTHKKKEGQCGNGVTRKKIPEKKNIDSPIVSNASLGDTNRRVLLSQVLLRKFYKITVVVSSLFPRVTSAKVCQEKKNPVPNNSQTAK